MKKMQRSWSHLLVQQLEQNLTMNGICMMMVDLMMNFWRMMIHLKWRDGKCLESKLRNFI